MCRTPGEARLGHGAIEARTHRASRGRDRDWTARRGGFRLRRRRAPRARVQHTHVPWRVADAGAGRSWGWVWCRDDNPLRASQKDGPRRTIEYPPAAKRAARVALPTI